MTGGCRRDDTNELGCFAALHGSKPGRCAGGAAAMLLDGADAFL